MTTLWPAMASGTTLIANYWSDLHCPATLDRPDVFAWLGDVDPLDAFWAHLMETIT